MAPYSPLPALSHMTGVNQTAGIPISALPHAFRYQSIKCGRRNCSAAPPLKAAPCRSRSPGEAPGRFGSAVSPLVGSAENWWSKEEENLSFPADGGKDGTASPLPPCACHPCSTRPAVQAWKCWAGRAVQPQLRAGLHWRSWGKYCCNNLPIN